MREFTRIAADYDRGRRGEDVRFLEEEVGRLADLGDGSSRSSRAP